MIESGDVSNARRPPEAASGVIGNARITGTFGAVIFVLLFLEGLTVLRVGSLISMHVFVGMLLVPFVIVKMASTGYRFVRYYGGRAGYTDKGPPPLLLRVLGPVVVATTVVLFATGIGALLTDRRTRWLLFAHKASFVLWFGAMTIHVLGHALETPALAVADLRRAARQRVPGASARIALLLVTCAVALALGAVSIGWVHHWRSIR
ncbi:MAG: hypothetical protein ACLPVY_18560 [Acidimicrobiia bacterium]